MSDPADERGLVESARTGDGQAFSVLYERYVDRVYSFVLFRVRDDSVAATDAIANGQRPIPFPAMKK